MSRRKKEPFIVRDVEQLNLSFYRRFDHDFLYAKAVTLMMACEDGEQYQAKLADLAGEPVGGKFFDALRAELHFTEMHQFEGFFALLLAAFQPLPHWLYLTEYETWEIKEAARKFVGGDIAGITGGRFHNDRDFLRRAVYSGFWVRGTGPNADADRWDANLDNIAWLIRHIAEKYLAGTEYNAYKHGIRVMTGQTSLSMHPTGRPDQAAVLAASEDSLCFLETRDDGEGGRTVYETTKHFDPRDSFLNLAIMRRLLEVVRATRLAVLTKEGSPALHQFADIDRDSIRHLRKYGGWSFTV